MPVLVLAADAARRSQAPFGYRSIVVLVVVVIMKHVVTICNSFLMCFLFLCL